MIWQLVKTVVVLALLGAVGWGVWRESGPVTAVCVGLVFAAIAGLDRRTRAVAPDAFAELSQHIENLQAGESVRLPDEEEES